MLDNLQFGRTIAVERTGYHLQSLQLPYAHIIALHNRARGKFLPEQFGQDLLDRFGSLRQRLQHEHVVINIDNQRRQQIAFRINQAVGIGIGDNSLASGRRFTDSPAPPFAIDGLVQLSQQPQSDL